MARVLETDAGAMRRAAALLDADASGHWLRGERYAAERAPWLARSANRLAAENQDAADRLREIADATEGK